MQGGILLLVGLYVILLLADLFANILSFIPFLGNIAETTTELVIETISAGIVGYLAVRAGK